MEINLIELILKILFISFITLGQKIKVMWGLCHYCQSAAQSILKMIIMKKLFFLIFLSLNTCYCFSFDLKRGIYKSFQEMKNNSPSLGTEFIVEVETVLASSNYHWFAGSYGFYTRDAKAKIYKLKGADSKKIKELENAWGFCDGKYIYIRYNFHEIPFDIRSMNNPVKFSRLYPTGKYFNYYQVEQRITVTDFTHNKKGSATILEPYTLNFETGEIIKLNEKNVKKILEDDPELLNTFSEDKKSASKMLFYLEEYNKRNTSEDWKNFKLPVKDSADLKKGIYNLFEEYNLNAPALTGEFTFTDSVITGYKKEKKNYSEENIVLYDLRIKEFSNKANQYIWGFTDGRNIYVRTSNDYFSSNYYFLKGDYLGCYIYYKDVIKNTDGTIKRTNGKLLSTQATIIVEKIINPRNGGVFELNKKNLEKILIEKAPELKKKYDSDPEKGSKLLEYLKEYCSNY